MVVVLVVLN